MRLALIDLRPRPLDARLAEAILAHRRVMYFNEFTITIRLALSLSHLLGGLGAPSAPRRSIAMEPERGSRCHVSDWLLLSLPMMAN